VGFEPPAPLVNLSFSAASLRPRYHFAALADCHYERLPYRQLGALHSSATPTTSFVGLGRCGNSSGCKWLYACQLAPVTPQTTACPYEHVVRDLQQQLQAEKVSATSRFAARAAFWAALPGRVLALPGWRADRADAGGDGQTGVRGAGQGRAGARPPPAFPTAPRGFATCRMPRQHAAARRAGELPPLAVRVSLPRHVT